MKITKNIVNVISIWSEENRNKTFRVVSPVSVASVKGTEFAAIINPSGVESQPAQLCAARSVKVDQARFLLDSTFHFLFRFLFPFVCVVSHVCVLVLVWVLV